MSIVSFRHARGIVSGEGGEATSLRIKRSNAWFATSRLRRRFSCSKAFRRFDWSTRSPPSWLAAIRRHHPSFSTYILCSTWISFSLRNREIRIRIMYERVCSTVHFPILVQRLAPGGTNQSTQRQSSIPLFYRIILHNHAWWSTHRLEASLLLYPGATK